jgi:hypothetical protein
MAEAVEPDGAAPLGKIVVSLAEVERRIAGEDVNLCTMSIDADGMVYGSDAAGGDVAVGDAPISFQYKRVHCVPGMCVEKTSDELIEDVKRAIVEAAGRKGFGVEFV